MICPELDAPFSDAAGMAWALNAMNVNSAAIDANTASSLRMDDSPGGLNTPKIEHIAVAMAMA